MALIQPYRNPRRAIDCPQAYYRVEGVALFPKATPPRAEIVVAPYASVEHAHLPVDPHTGLGPEPIGERMSFAAQDSPAQTQETGGQVVEVQPASTDWSDLFADAVLRAQDTTPVAQAYVVLKRSPLFKGAVDA